MTLHLRQPLRFDKGIGRFEEKASISRREAYINTSSLEIGGRKSPLKLKKSVGFQPICCLIYGFCLILRLFYLYFGLFRFYQI